MVLNSNDLAKMMSAQAREEMLLALADYFGNESSNIKAAAHRSKIQRLTNLPNATEDELLTAKTGNVVRFVQQYRNRVGIDKVSMLDAKDYYELIRNNP